LPTLDKTEISRLAPLIQGATASCRGIRPSMPPREKYSVWSLPQRLAVPSKSFTALQGCFQVGQGAGRRGTQSLREKQTIFRHDRSSYLPPAAALIHHYMH